MIIAHNMAAMNTQRNLNITGNNKNKALERLSSGYKINRAADNAAGLAISEEMRGQIKGLNRASLNIEDGHSILATTDAAMQEMHDILHRARELSVQAANDTNTNEDREMIQLEIDGLVSEIDRLSEQTEFNTIKVFKGFYDKKIIPSGGSIANSQNAGKIAVDLATTGLAMVVGKDNITTTGYMNQSLVFDTSFESTGKVKFGGVQDISGASNIVRNIPSSLQLQNYNGGSNTASGVQVYNIINNGVVAGSVTGTTPGSTRVREYNLTKYIYNATYLPSGNNATSMTYTVEEQKIKRQITETLQADGVTWTASDSSSSSGSLSGDTILSSNPNFGEGKQSAINGRANGACGSAGPTGSTTYKGSAFVDFKNLNQVPGFTLDQLEGLGFNTSCCTCNDRYNIEFVKNGGNFTDKTSGSNVGYKVEGTTLKIDLDSFASNVTGADFAKGIFDAAKESNYTKHFTQFAYSTNSATKLYVFDNGPSYYGKGNMGVFEPIVRKKGKPVVPGTIQTNDTGGIIQYELSKRILQVGANSNQIVDLDLPLIDAKVLGINILDVTEQKSADNSIAIIDSAIDYVSKKRTDVGALDNRLTHAYSNATNMSENLQASESKIRDADMADEMVTFSAQNILEQAGMSVLAQANQSKQGILSLLG